MLTERSKQVRRGAFKLAKANGGYHFGGSFSCAEILIALYDKVLRHNDVFILSKGHGCWCWYVLLREKGLHPKLEGHPYRDPANGVYWTTGSLGHGFPAAVGVALARKIQKRVGRVFVLMGDGEVQEGTTWESLLLARKHNLDNLFVIVDANNCQGSCNLCLPSHFIGQVAKDCRWWVNSVADGHDIDFLASVFQRDYPSGQPVLTAAQTIKGKGVSFMESRPEWHAKFPNAEQEKQMMEELS